LADGDDRRQQAGEGADGRGRDEPLDGRRDGEAGVVGERDAAVEQLLQGKVAHQHDRRRHGDHPGDGRGADALERARRARGTPSGAAVVMPL
jgi:hypothetical protein